MNSFAMLHVGLQPYPGYKLVQVIGRGAFAEVWEAERDDGQKLALKFIPAGNHSIASKEIRSIQCIRQLEHPHLIRIEQVWCHLGFVVVAMELAEGSLHELFVCYKEQHESPLPHETVLDYLTQAADVLDVLNARQHKLNGQRVGYQHCDVKPSNMLLCGETVKLCDFGLAAPTTAKLRSHRRAGTLDFTAPEVFQGRLSNWTDQYALAVTYCQLRGGRLPFPDSPNGFKASYVRPAPDLTMVPSEERPILARALSATPQQRWPSCLEMMAQLTALTDKGSALLSRPEIVIEEPDSSVEIMEAVEEADEVDEIEC
jgi:serine/threonine protein kinase, bacterial